MQSLLARIWGEVGNVAALLRLAADAHPVKRRSVVRRLNFGQKIAN